MCERERMCVSGTEIECLNRREKYSVCMSGRERECVSRRK